MWAVRPYAAGRSDSGGEGACDSMEDRNRPARPPRLAGLRRDQSTRMRPNRWHCPPETSSPSSDRRRARESSSTAPTPSSRRTTRSLGSPGGPAMRSSDGTSSRCFPRIPRPTPARGASAPRSGACRDGTGGPVARYPLRPSGGGGQGLRRALLGPGSATRSSTTAGTSRTSSMRSRTSPRSSTSRHGGRDGGAARRGQEHLRGRLRPGDLRRPPRPRRHPDRRESQLPRAVRLHGRRGHRQAVLGVRLVEPLGRGPGLVQGRGGTGEGR